MTISDEWDIPEKQPFKDLVRVWDLYVLERKAGQPCGLQAELLRSRCCWPESLGPPGARGRNMAFWMEVDGMSSIPCLWFFFQGNLRYWLEEAECRDQYSVIFESGDRTSIFWNDVKDPVSIEERAVGVCCHVGAYCVFLWAARWVPEQVKCCVLPECIPEKDILHSGFEISHKMWEGFLCFLVKREELMPCRRRRLCAACWGHVHTGSDFYRRGGRRRTCDGPPRAPTWPRSISEASLSGAERSSSKSRDSATRGFSSLTSRLVRGKQGGEAGGVRAHFVPASVLTVQLGFCSHFQPNGSIPGDIGGARVYP